MRMIKQFLQRKKNQCATGSDRITNELKASIPVLLDLWILPLNFYLFFGIIPSIEDRVLYCFGLVQG